MEAEGGGLGVPTTWEEELASLVEDTGIRYVPPAAATAEDLGMLMPGKGEGFASGFGLFNGYMDAAAPGAVPEESLQDQVKGFLKASGELMQDLGRSCWDIAQQSMDGVENSYVARRLRGPVAVASERLKFLNEYLPEDRDPLHAWPVVIFVFLLALSALTVNSEHRPSAPLPKKIYVHPASATRIQLIDGRHLAYWEQGVPADRARFTVIAPHSFLSSRLAGIPGIKGSLLDEFGVRLITYDLPGFGESDPHPDRTLNSSALDMLNLANSLGIGDKFWVVGFSGGGMHAWAAVRYIPNSIAGAAMLAPMCNPYDTSLTKEEKYKAWEKWTTRRKLMYVLARKFPSLLHFFYRRSILSGKHGQPEEWLSLSVGKKDKALLEDQVFKEFWERDVEESVRQGSTLPFVEEAVLQVSNWGFSLADIQVQKKRAAKGLLSWFKSLYSQEEPEWTGFLGPIHIWQGLDDQVVPPSMTEFARRVIPGATVHKLLDEGHFSYFCFCDECHRHIFSTLFGIPQGPLELPLEDEDSLDGEVEEACQNCTSKD